ncbi:hypothetical protein HPB51_018324 [Rhipicephalus microplus]|uniref:Uncharacterized protein n=1 Tax=Rhipicephalus microplus TaxID=6941 RepID=A0A9J6DBL7_RHIMP|nr:hypothetical protein HPB51_018324 [Rhipicephalus microplus]
MGDRSPDVKYLEPRGGPPTVAILQVHEQMSRGDPPAKRGAPVGKPSRRPSRSTGLFGLFTRIHDELRSRTAVTQSGRRSLYSIALGRINQLASWVHALWMAKKSADEDADVQEYYNALRSEEEDWSTTVTAAELALEDSTDFKDVPL